MTNLDSILKSRDITLPAKVHLVQAMVSPVVTYGCESWTIKKAECWRIDAVELWCWWRLLRVPWTARRSNKSILKEIIPEYLWEGHQLKLKLQCFVQLFETPWTAACQAFLSITNSRSLLKLMFIESVMPSNHLIPFSSYLQSFSASGSFQMSQLFTSSGRNIGVSASTSVLPINIQDWFPLGWTCWISLLSKGLSRVFSNTTVQKHKFFSTQVSLWSNSHIHTWLLEKS